MTLHAAYVESPVGRLLIAVDDDGTVRTISLHGDAAALNAGHLETGPVVWDHPLTEPLRAELNEYFRGERQEFDLPLSPAGTAFQLAVWKELVSIPYGETISYLDLAIRIGNRKAVRAVGGANGANPIPILIPCHRVIGAGGSLVGYGGGLPMKEALLALERPQRRLRI